jgi:hypothetical protein
MHRLPGAFDGYALANPKPAWLLMSDSGMLRDACATMAPAGSVCFDRKKRPFDGSRPVARFIGIAFGCGGGADGMARLVMM